MANILLLEPNRMLAGSYKDFLEKEGHEVIWSQSAQKSINYADQNRPDVVIMELALAGHSGIEFLYEFRSYPEWREVPVIILSRIAPETMANQSDIFIKLGVKEYLYKPETNLKNLSLRLNKLLDGIKINQT